MKPVIPLYVTFTNWILTVLAGSLLLPFTSGSYGEGVIVGVSFILSALCSLPALILLLFIHLVLNKKVKTLQNHQLIQNGFHLLVTVLTFSVLWTKFGSPSERSFFLAIIFTYSPIGFIIWNITYWSYKRKKTENTDAIDKV